jgi:hypothetical protein
MFIIKKIIIRIHFGILWLFNVLITIVRDILRIFRVWSILIRGPLNHHNNI